mgnify:CR=1 FL=1
MKKVNRKLNTSHSVEADEERQVIGTHNGTFHCDEALAVYMLKLTDTYRDAGV